MSELLVAVGDVFVQIPQRWAAASVMGAAQAAAREEEGCISFTFAEALEDPGHFLVVQSWSDQRALDAHYRSEGFARYQADISPLLVRDSELKIHLVERTVSPVESSGVHTRQDD